MTVLMQLIIKMQASSSRSDQVRILVLVLVLLLLVGLFGAGPAWSGWPGWSGPLPSSSLDTFFFPSLSLFSLPFLSSLPVTFSPFRFWMQQDVGKDMGHGTLDMHEWVMGAPTCKSTEEGKRGKDERVLEMCVMSGWGEGQSQKQAD